LVTRIEQFAQDMRPDESGCAGKENAITARDR
jgi:hypothetical protein